MTTERLRAALADRYRVERQLGEGGMATVYLAEDLKHRRKVAIKVLKPELAAVLGTERFLQEITTTANLRHPHILPLFDSGAIEGPGDEDAAPDSAGSILYYVMPLVDGESLRARLDREKQLPLEASLQITREVADALGHAHARGVIHRDIKPENILLEGGHAIVADFGIAKVVGAVDRTTLTRTGLALGTPGYMSPEQAAGAGDLDGRTDQYALACVLYEMLAGQPPFTGATVEALVRQHLVVDAQPVTNFRPTVPATVSVALHRALAKAPADRFDPVTRFAEALRGSGETAATPGPIPARPTRRIGMLAATVVLGLALFGSVWWRGRGRPAVAAAASVAVLPFDDLSADKANAYLGDGIAETLINALTGISGMQVAARTSAFAFRERSDAIKAIGTQLGVATVLQGSVQRSGDRLRITAQLVSVADGRVLWSERFDRGVNDIFAVQDEVARAVVVALSGRQVGQAAAEGGTHDPAAYDAYLLGRFYWHKRTVDGLLRATDYFKQAIRADSTYAMAWTGLADAYVVSTQYHVPDLDEEATLQLAEAAARHAIALAPERGEPFASLGQVQQIRRQWRASNRSLQRAVALAPLYPTAHQWYARNLMIWNQWDDAIAELEQARKLDPLSFIIVITLAYAYDHGGRADESPPLYEQAEAIAPGHDLTKGFRFGRAMALGQMDSAATAYEALLRLRGEDSSTAAAVAARLRDPARRTAALRRLAASEDPHWVILIHRLLDGNDATLGYLQSLVGNPQAEATDGVSLLGALGPELRAKRQTQEIMIRLGYPDPREFERIPSPVAQ